MALLLSAHRLPG